MRWILWGIGALMSLGSFGTPAQDSVARAALRSSLPPEVRKRLESGQDSSLTMTAVVVSKGQTLSGLSFHHLGAFTPEILKILLADNPGLKDPSRIFEGETLQFRRRLDRRQLAPERQVAMASRQVVVTFVEGLGEVVRAGGKKEVLRANQFLIPGDIVSVKGGSRVEMIVDNQSILRLLGPSRLALLAVQSSVSGEPRPRTRVRLIGGTLWAKVEKWAGPLVHFEVQLPNAVAGVHGTVFESIAEDDSSGLVRVHEGVVAVRPTRHPGSDVFVGANQEVGVARGGVISPLRQGKPKSRIWEKFNRARDQEIETAEQSAMPDQRSDQTLNPSFRRNDASLSSPNTTQAQPTTPNSASTPTSAQPATPTQAPAPTTTPSATQPVGPTQMQGPPPSPMMPMPFPMNRSKPLHPPAIP